MLKYSKSVLYHRCTYSCSIVNNWKFAMKNIWYCKEIVPGAGSSVALFYNSKRIWMMRFISNFLTIFCFLWMGTKDLYMLFIWYAFALLLVPISIKSCYNHFCFFPLFMCKEHFLIFADAWELYRNSAHVNGSKQDPFSDALEILQSFTKLLTCANIVIGISMA